MRDEARWFHCLADCAHVYLQFYSISRQSSSVAHITCRRFHRKLIFAFEIRKKKENEHKVDESHASTCIFYWFACQIHFCFFALRMGCVELWFLLPYCRFFVVFCLMKFASCFREVGDILRPINLLFFSRLIIAFLLFLSSSVDNETHSVNRMNWFGFLHANFRSFFGWLMRICV